MAQAPLPDSIAMEAYEATVRGGTISAGARLRGVPEPTHRRQYLAAVERLGQPDVRFTVDRGSKATEVPPFQVAPLPSGDEPIEDLIARRAAAYSRKHEAREARELVPVSVHLDGAYGILHMGDPHVDDDGCDWPTLLRHLETVDRTEGLFAANVGDMQNNWIGRLARLYGSQGTSAKDALRMVEWFIGRTRWLYLIGGNHDAWSGTQDPVRWFAGQAGHAYEWHGMRLALRSPNGREVRINARHDFQGASQWNGAHAPAKAAMMGWHRDHIYSCGHRHSAAHNTLFFNNGEHVAHAIRLGAYKVHDDFAESKGFPKQNAPAAVTIINPDARDAFGLVTVFWDVEAAADYLRFLRRPRVRVAARSA